MRFTTRDLLALTGIAAIVLAMGIPASAADNIEEYAFLFGVFVLAACVYGGLRFFASLW